MYPDPDVTLGCKDIEKNLVVSQKVSIFATEKYLPLCDVVYG
jgi:hypothetical protein